MHYYSILFYVLFNFQFSFIGHSMGNLIIRRILDREEMRPLLHKLSVFVSLCGPHLGSLVYTSGLVQAG